MSSPSPRSDKFVSLGMSVAAISAGVSSFAGLRSLALLAGWSDWSSLLFPLCIDAYALSATRVWLTAPQGADRARRWARANAIGAILLSLSGNGAAHLLAAHLLELSWLIITGVSAVPAVVLGLCTHLAVLRSQVGPDGPVRDEDGTRSVLAKSEVGPEVPIPEPRTAPPPARQRAKQPPAPRDRDALLALAREVDAAHRAANHGRPLTRDVLRQALRVGGTTATTLARQLREERETA